MIIAFCGHSRFPESKEYAKRKNKIIFNIMDEYF